MPKLGIRALDKERDMQKIIIRSLFVAIAIFAVSAVAVPPAFSQVAVGISVGFGPPAIPVYDQPECPGDGYIWTPGYWAWDADVDDYYWVPGTWVEPPDAGLLWTPGYWAWGGNGFVFTDGYWGPVVGFYGGINYGFGYFGDGFYGGRWDGGHFYYNTAVWHVNRTVVHNVYENRVTIVNNSHVSYNGGNGGLTARASAQDEAARNERHVEAVAAQRQQRDDARGNQQLRASANHGKPPIAATDKPGEFNDHAVKAKEAGGAYNPPANRGNAAANAGAANTADRNETRTNNDAARANNETKGMTANRPSQSNNTYVHPKDLPAYQKPAAPSTGNPKMDQKYQQQQDKLAQQQDKQRQQLETRQDKEHQQYQKQKADDARNQALEQKHTQQTQQLQQRQQAAQQHMQQRQAPPAHAEAPSGHGGAPADKDKK